MNRTIKAENLKLAALRYYDKRKGVELTDPLGYVILEKVGKDMYVNPLDIVEEYPIFEVMPHSNITASSDEYGNNMRLINGIDVGGPCYVLFNSNLKDSFDTNLISEQELKEYILRSNYYFIDRKKIALERIKKYPIKMYRVLKEDEESEEKVLEFFGEKGVQLQKVR